MTPIASKVFTSRLLGIANAKVGRAHWLAVSQPSNSSVNDYLAALVARDLAARALTLLSGA